MKTPKHLPLLAALSLAWLALTPVEILAQKGPCRNSKDIAVTGQSDWSIVPPAIPSEYVTFHDDGTVTIERLPLAGVFSITGDGTGLEATIKGVLSADLDPTLTGPIYGPLLLTQTVKGREVVIFEGRFFGRVDNLLASGLILFHGRGHYTGVTIAVSFLETGNNTETFILNGHWYDAHPH
jgi:hypothetical protein